MAAARPRCRQRRPRSLPLPLPGVRSIFSVQLRRLQKLEAIGRRHRDVESDALMMRAALMMHGERHVDAGSAERPHLLVEAGLARDLLAVNGEDDVAGLELGASSR